MSGLLRLFIRANFDLPADPKTSFRGKTVIVTGSNTGIGFEAAIKFVALDALKVILAVRNMQKGERAKRAIENETGKYGVLDVWHLDMESYDSMRQFARRVETELEHLDIAILNAGLMMSSFTRSPYDWELTLQVNVLSTALLALLLLPKLRTSKRVGSIPVLEFVSSGRAFQARIDEAHEHSESLLASYNTPQGFSGRKAYPLSKLFLQFFVSQLAQAMSIEQDGTPAVAVLSTSPGACKSELGRAYYKGFLVRVIMAVMHAIFFRTAEAGARSLVSGAALGKKGHGIIWQHDKFDPLLPPFPRSKQAALQDRLWAEITEAIRTDFPEIQSLGARYSPRNMTT